MTIMLQNPGAGGAENGGTRGRVAEADKEHSIRLPRAAYEQLSARRMELSSLVSAHIIWDNEECAIVLLGTEESVHQTASVLSQCLVSASSSAAPRKLVGRSLHTLNSLHTQPQQQSSSQSLDAAKTLLLRSQLPPELSICQPQHSPGTQPGTWSTMVGAGHSPLGRTVSDHTPSHAPGHQHHARLRTEMSYDPCAQLLGAGAGAAPLSNLSRRKLESEDSSYDSDHENLAAASCAASGGLAAASLVQVSRSHEDVTRTYSETLGQEFSEYVSLAPSLSPDSALPGLCSVENLSPRSGLTEPRESREASPVHSAARNLEQDTGDRDQYYQKVEFALKLGYPEDLTRKALGKVGLAACNDDLLNELIRLQQTKVVDPKEALLKESCGELVSLATSAAASDPPAARAGDAAPAAASLRAVVIDGSNVAMAHGNSECFSCRGIEICVDWFKQRGHKDVKVILPRWRKESSKPDTPTTGQHILKKLEKDKVLYYSPSRQVGGQRIVPHDDKYILNLASESGAIVVSNDHYRELINDKKEFKEVIEKRILMYTFVDDRFMPPDDPLGRNGPTLDTFLRVPASPAVGAAPGSAQPCPYGMKCTYGNKCKFFHAERGNVPIKTVTDKLKEQSSRRLQEVRTRNTSRDSSPGADLGRAKSQLALARTQSDVTAFARKAAAASAQQPVSRTLSSRPLYSGPGQHKSEVAKSKSVEAGARFPPQPRLAEAEAGGWGGSGPGSGLELGCLNSYGLGWPRPHLLHQPPPPPPAQQHRKLERQLTINPAFDPRINKQQPEAVMLTSEAMDYMHRNPPPPFGLVNISEAGELGHRDVTRNASAPDSIKHWGRDQVPGPAPAEQLPCCANTGSNPAASAAAEAGPGMQRLNSGSDTQLNRGLAAVNKTFSADPFSASETWKYGSMSPLLGTSIWSAPAPGLASPPVSPARNLGPVGSRPGAGAGPGGEERLQQFSHLANIFPAAQVEAVMALLPHERDTAVLCKKIIEMFP